MTSAVAPSIAGAPVLSVDRLSCGYGASAILRDVSFEIGKGEIFALLGRNGMGKTTLVRTIMGFLAPFSGAIQIGGADVRGSSPAAMVTLGISYAPQEKAIFQDFSISDNLKLAARSDREYRDLLPNVFELFPFLEQRLSQPAGTLSGGEQKMLIIGRALMTKPRLVLLDEVSEGLQPSAVDRLAEILSKARRSFGTSILLVEQNIKLAWRVSDRWAVLKGGLMAEQGKVTPDALRTVSSHLAI